VWGWDPRGLVGGPEWGGRGGGGAWVGRGVGGGVFVPVGEVGGGEGGSHSPSFYQAESEPPHPRDTEERSSPHMAWQQLCPLPPEKRIFPRRPRRSYSLDLRGTRSSIPSFYIRDTLSGLKSSFYPPARKASSSPCALFSPPPHVLIRLNTLRASPFLMTSALIGWIVRLFLPEREPVISSSKSRIEASLTDEPLPPNCCLGSFCGALPFSPSTHSPLCSSTSLPHPALI